MVRVRTLLEMPGLRLSVRVGGELLDREVSRVCVAELPNPSQYLTGGELVISELLWWQQPEDANVFVRALAEHGAAALVTSGVDLGEVLEELQRSCEHYGVALLEVPSDLPCTVIAERAESALTAEREATEPDGHRRLLRAVSEGNGLSGLLQAATADLDAPCWVRTATGRVVAGSPVLGPEITLDIPERSPQAVVPWHLVIGTSRSLWRQSRQAATEQLASQIALERSRVEQERAVEARVAGPLLGLLVLESPSPAELATQLAAFGIPADQSMRVLAASITGRRPELSSALLQELLAELGVAGPVGMVNECAYALADGAGWPTDSAERANKVMHAVQPTLNGCTSVVGISGPVAASGLLGAAAEARHAMQLGQRRGGHIQVVAGEEVAAHRLLLASTPDELRRSLRERLLGPVLDYDAAHGSDLSGTLRAFLECSGSPTVAATRLHVHVNTLRYRIGRASDLLGTDVTEFSNQVDLYLALQMEN